MATGCAGALELCFSVLFEGGSNVLVPAPGYSLYNCLGGVLQVSLKYYNLLVGDLYVWVRAFSVHTHTLHTLTCLHNTQT